MLPSTQETIDQFKKDICFFKIIQRILLIAMLGACVYIGRLYYILSKTLGEEIIQISVPDQPFEQEQKNAQFRKPDGLPALKKRMRRRNIFVDYRKESQKLRLAETKVKGPEIVALDRLIKLQGIILKEKPIAVVQNLSNRETHFLNVGDRIQAAEILEITSEKVIFSYNKRNVEFKL